MKHAQLKHKNNVNTMAFFNILGPVLLNGINFFTIPIFTRMLGTDNYGIYTIYATWVNVLTIFISLQVQGTLGVANIQLALEEKEKYCSSILTISMLSFVVCFAIVIIWMPQFSLFFGLAPSIVILMMFHALGMAFINFATTKFTYDKQAHKTFLVSVVVAISGIAMSLLFLYHIHDTKKLYLGRTYGSAIPYIILGVLLGVLFFSKGRTGYNKKYWSFCLPLCLPLVFHGLSHLILGQADRVMLQKMSTDSMVGIYGFTATFANIMNIIYNAFNTTWVPFYYDDMKSGDIGNIKSRTKNYIFVFTIISIGFVLLAPEVVKIFASREFWDGIILVPILVLGNFMMFLYSFPVNFEFYHRKTTLIAFGTGGAAIANCLLNYLLIPDFGMLGAAVATLLSYTILWFFHHLVAKYIIKEEYAYKIQEFIPALIGMMLGCGAGIWLREFIFLRWGIAVLLGVILVIRVWKQKSIF